MAIVNAKFRKVILDIIKAAGKEEEFQKALAENNTAHVRIINGSWMPLSIEAIGNHAKSNLPQISVCHYGKQNGDLMRDPEMIFEIHPDGHWIPNCYRNDFANSEKNLVARRDERGFPILWFKEKLTFIWSRNLKHQGFIEAAKQLKN